MQWCLYYSLVMYTAFWKPELRYCFHSGVSKTCFTSRLGNEFILGKLWPESKGMSVFCGAFTLVKKKSTTHLSTIVTNSASGKVRIMNIVKKSPWRQKEVYLKGGIRNLFFFFFVLRSVWQKISVFRFTLYRYALVTLWTSTFGDVIVYSWLFFF